MKRATADYTRLAATHRNTYEGLTFDGLCHTAITKMAEAGVPESKMLALAGHMSRAMLERYSHVRMNAKREAVEVLNLPQISATVPAKAPALAENPLVQ
jgi:hypothetical protein